MIISLWAINFQLTAKSNLGAKDLKKVNSHFCKEAKKQKQKKKMKENVKKFLK
jgi:hypothetical protein